MKKYIPLLVILVLLFIMLIVNNYRLAQAPVKKQARYLPIIGEKKLEGKDTTYHSISDFTFTNQLGQAVSKQDLAGKNFVVEFFFTTCQSICPIMNDNMMLVADAFKNDSTFKILSHTVKPQEDSVPTLAAYATAHKANAKQWHFLTGSKKELYAMARKSYLMDSQEGNGGEDDFVHTQLFALVDKGFRIRGFYDGTSDSEVQKLIADIRLLKREQEENERITGFK